MAAPACTNAGFSAASACFNRSAFSAHEQKAIIAYLWWKWADTVDTLVNYATLSQLQTAAACLNVLDQGQRDAALIAVLNRGEDGLGHVSANSEIAVLTSETAASAICQLKYLSDAELDTLILFNQCRFFGAWDS